MLNYSSFRLFVLVFLTGIILAVNFSGCDKEDQKDQDSGLISFTRLVAGSDTLVVGASTTITAEYEGEDVSFEWEATSGNLLGGGDKVEYHVNFCDIGMNTITCKASATNNTITRTINIVVNVE